jgi:hypothetical protein
MSTTAEYRKLGLFVMPMVYHFVAAQLRSCNRPARMRLTTPHIRDFSLPSILRLAMNPGFWTELRRGPIYLFLHNSVSVCSGVWDRTTEGGF